jgi:hypothetical protein
MTLPVEDRELQLTGGYVKALAERQDSLTLAQHPILAVLSAGGTFRKEVVLATGPHKILSL